jgi:hypothetical protein
MSRWDALKKVFHGFLIFSYGSFSLAIIACFFHHDELQQGSPDLVYHSHEQHGHPHGPSEHSSKPEDLFCKFVQNVSGAALTSSLLSSQPIHTALHETKPETAVIFRTAEKIYHARAPPVAFS